MYQGVVKDDARRQKKRQQREEEFLLSKEKRERYEAVQEVAKGSKDAVGVGSVS